MNIRPAAKSPKTLFKRIWTNKVVLKGLETVSEHSASFIAGTSFIMASGVRPLTIAATPNVKKENKEYAITNSIASGFVKFAFVESIALPIENAVKKIEKNPEKFLKSDTINTFKNEQKELGQSRKFKFAAQFMKLSTGLITAIPKSMLTVALIPILMDKIYSSKNKPEPKKTINNSPSFKKLLTSNCLQPLTKPPQTGKTDIVYTQCAQYNTGENKSNEKLIKPSFKGNYDITAKRIGKIFNWKSFQKFAEKFKEKDENVARNMTIATDILLTGAFAHQTIENKSIEEERKKPLILNSLYSTGASLLGGCTIDKIVKKNTAEFTNKFSHLNKNDPKLAKYIEGINIIRPTLIFAGIYYGILPIITTYLADKSDKNIDK